MKVLVVEDNKKIASFLQKGLTQEGFVVDIAEDGKEGFYLATTNSYDVMLLDIMLPFMSGIELCKSLREQEIITPILMLTAKDDSDDIVAGLDSGADDYITKPFVFKELLARLRVIQRRGLSLSKELVFKDLKLDPSKKTVQRENKHIELTAKEFALLELLVRNQNNILSESVIIDSIWDMNYSNASNLVKVYIYRLRNKIDKGFKEAYIHTIKNFGYSLR